ncbi:MAG: radical SAM-associated putative lipoprotein [Dysgonomonas sp.]
MKIKMLTIYSRILSFFLVLLGFTSCDEIDPKDEYGSPYAKFIIKGIVVDGDSEDNTPVKGIKVVIARSYEKDNGERFLYHTDSLKTDNNGYFNLATVDFPSSQEFVIKFEDIDGTENGLFESKTDDISFENPKFENGNSWYQGETSKDMGIIKITPQKTEE